MPVSIHAPHEGERRNKQIIFIKHTRFQSTLPTRGSDPYRGRARSIAPPFQSTLPTRGSDGAECPCAEIAESFNPRSPRGGATRHVGHTAGKPQVSIHAPHEGERRYGIRQRPAHTGFQSTLPTRGSDVSPLARDISKTLFQSTLPTRGSDPNSSIVAVWPQVSIHAPHEGERPRFSRHRRTWTVSIHAPHEGERRKLRHKEAIKMWFQSTLPTRGSDLCLWGETMKKYGFNPRSPRGGATAEKCICMQHFREFAEYYPLRHGDARCIAPQDCIIQAFFGAKKRCFYVRLCFALKNKGVRG